MLLRPGYLPIPYVIALLPFAALAAAAVVDRLWTVCRVGPVGAAAVAAAAAVVVAPAWATSLERQTTPGEPSPAAQAADSVAGSVPGTTG